MDDHQVLAQISSLVAEEHELREQRQAGDLGSDEERARLTQLEQALDQCWDLLRQRRARKEFGQNESDATVRPVEEVENYLQ
jgi:hypothetical protein